MRYADSGGLTAEDRARREDVRLQAARLFEQDLHARQIAKILWVSPKSVYQWRRAWRAGGDVALASKARAGMAASLMSSSWRGCAPPWMRDRPPLAGLPIRPCCRRSNAASSPPSTSATAGAAACVSRSNKTRLDYSRNHEEKRTQCKAPGLLT